MNAQPIHFRCSHCDERHAINARSAGRSIICPTCRRETTVPNVSGGDRVPVPASVPLLDVGLDAVDTGTSTTHEPSTPNDAPSTTEPTATPSDAVPPTADGVPSWLFTVGSAFACSLALLGVLLAFLAYSELDAAQRRVYRLGGFVPAGLRTGTTLTFFGLGCAAVVCLAAIADPVRRGSRLASKGVVVSAAGVGVGLLAVMLVAFGLR